MKSELSFCLVASVGILFAAHLTLSEPSNSHQSHSNQHVEPEIVFKIERGQVNSGVKVVREGEEDVPTTTTPNPGDPSNPSQTNSSNLEECMGTENERGCCYQYTWPGPQYDTGENTGDTGTYTCVAHDKTYHSKEPCASPVVLTHNPNGNRPNLTELIEGDYKIYCRKTSCLQYSYYQNSKSGQKLWNQTKFCGNVLSQNTGLQIQKGCYKEKMEGYTREVCVCQGHLCNSAPGIGGLSPSLLYFGVVVLLSWIVSS